MSELSEFDHLMESKLKDFKSDVDEGTISGYVDGEQTYVDLMNELSSLGYSYSTRGSDYYKLDGKNIWFSKNSGKNRSPYIDAFGSPFSLVKTTYLHCALGSKYYSRSKENIFEIEEPNPKRRRTSRSARPTKKMDCPAWMTIKCVKVYPDFVTDKVIRRTKEKLSSILKSALKLFPPPRSFLRYYFKATVGQSHSHSTACMQLSQEIHPDLIKEIQRIVEHGKTSVRDVKMLLEQYVDKLFADGSKPKPARINKAFYPNEKVIYTHIYRAINSAKKSQTDQGVLAAEDCEYIIIDGEVAEIPQVIEVAEIFQVDEETANVTAVDEVVEIFEVEERNSTAVATDQMIEISQVHGQNNKVSAANEMVEVFQLDEGNHSVRVADEMIEISEVNNVSAANEVVEIFHVNEGNHNIPSANEVVAVHEQNHNVCAKDKVIEVAEVRTQNDNISASSAVVEISQVHEENHIVPTVNEDCSKPKAPIVHNVPIKVKMVKIPEVNEELHNVSEVDNSDTANVEKAQQNVRDEAKRIMDLSYHCNDTESLTNIHLALSQQRIQMESRVGILPLLLLSANDCKKTTTTPFKIETYEENE